MKNKKNILIDLTPLLDVILLLLFLVLIQTTTQIEEIYATIQQSFDLEIEQFKADFSDELDSLRQSYLDFDALRLGLEEDTHVIIITLAPAITPSTRTISVEANGSITTIDIDWNQIVRDQARLALDSVLAQSIQNATVSFIIFRYDSDNIFVDDHTLINLALQAQRLHRPNVFLAEIDLR